MGITVWPVDAVGGAPEYSGRDLRQALSPALAGATATRPLGALSGVRPGTPTDTVEVSGSTWTCHPHAGVIDGQSAAEAGPYWYAVDADVTGSVDAANATNPRQDLIYARVSDPAESDGSTDPEVEILYLAGTAASSPTPPATPARSIPLAVLNVPKVGGGATTVTWVAPYLPHQTWLVRSDAERDDLASALGPSDEHPVEVLHIGSANPRKGVREHTFDGASWQTGPSATWQSYTPTVSGLTVGTGGSVEGRFREQADGTVHIQIKAIMGSTGRSMGSPLLGYPAGVAPRSDMLDVPAVAQFTDVGAGKYPGVAYCQSDGIRVHAQGSPNGISTAITASVPFSWSTGDYIAVYATFEKAPA